MRITSSLYYKNKSLFIIKRKQYFLVYENIMCTVIYKFFRGSLVDFPGSGISLI